MKTRKRPAPAEPIERANLRPEFWRHHPLDELPRHEWEALCDGCGKCCLLKLEDEDTGDVAYTSVACRLLDLGTCRCGNYPLRRQLVPGCVVIDRDSLERIIDWMPRTCAYRLIHDGHDLYDWHPLISGDPNSVHRAGISFLGKMNAILYMATTGCQWDAPAVLKSIRHACPWLRHVFADGGYAGPKLRRALDRMGQWTLQIVKRSDTPTDFEVLPRRWVVERTFAWLGRCRRLAKDWEKSIASAEAWINVAHIRLTTRRLARCWYR